MNEKIKLLLEEPPVLGVPFWESSNSKLFIYGTGSMAQAIYHALTQSGLLISGFLDHRITIKPFLNGIPVLAPERAVGETVILGMHNRDAEIPRIVERLNLLGVKSIVSPVELYDFFGDVLGVRYWLTKRDYYFSFKALIQEASLLWADEASQLLYASILAFRVKGDYSLLPEPDLKHQYFPSDIPPLKTPLRFVDCGAFDGDTLLNFQKSNISFEAVSAFEPDENNFRKLVQFMQMNEEYFPSTNLWPCGVSSSTRQLQFDLFRGEASAASSEGSSTVQCVSLDDVIPSFRPTFIKMDIEGAEVDALLGARNLISMFRPRLAISVYHSPGHLWQIPLLINELAPGRYDYYLRAHAFNDFDIVLYAIPN